MNTITSTNISYFAYFCAIEKAMKRQIAKGVTYTRTVRFSCGRSGTIFFTRTADGRTLIKAHGLPTITVYRRTAHPGFGARIQFGQRSLASMIFGPDEKQVYKAAIRAAGY